MDKACKSPMVSGFFSSILTPPLFPAHLTPGTHISLFNACSKIFPAVRPSSMLFSLSWNILTLFNWTDASPKTHYSLTMLKPLTVWITTNCWKILKEMVIPDHLTCLLRNPYAGQEGTVRTGHVTMDWFQIGKAVHQGCILSPCLFNFMESISCEMLDWIKHKLESRLQGEISANSDMQITPPLWQKVKRN